MKIFYIFLLAIVIGGYQSAFDQTPTSGTYEVKYSSTMDHNLFEKAISKCNLDPYRRLNQRTELHFTDGTILELFSANELVKAGYPINLNTINKVGDENYNAFTVHPDGYVLEEVWKFSKEDLVKHQNERKNK